MDDGERHAAIQDAKFPEGNLPFDEDCPEECHEGRHYKHGDIGCAQYVLCGCAERLIAEREEKAKKSRALEEIKKDLRDVRTEITNGPTAERQAELVDKLRVLRVEQVQVERSAEKGASDGQRNASIKDPEGGERTRRVGEADRDCSG